MGGMTEPFTGRSMRPEQMMSQPRLSRWTRLKRWFLHLIFTEEQWRPPT
jgi:hypothetical protein